MKAKKKFLSLLLAAAMILSLLPTAALATEGEKEPTQESGECICETLCAVGAINANCALCAEDFNICAGQASADPEDFTKLPEDEVEVETRDLMATQKAAAITITPGKAAATVGKKPSLVILPFLVSQQYPLAADI